MNSEHRYLRLVSPPPKRRLLREIAVALMNQLFGVQFSRSKWQKVPAQTLAWWYEGRDAAGSPIRHHKVSKQLSLALVEQDLESGTFHHEAFVAPQPKCNWLDSMVHTVPKFHAVDDAGRPFTFIGGMALGDGFPLEPRLDREGQMFTSFQVVLLRRIRELRERLTETSHQFETAEWFQNLRSYVTECVSLVDTTLHQLYFMAQYAPQPGWKFNPSRLGPRHGASIADKLGWVYQITGHTLSEPQAMRDFLEIKNLRNHLQHFDPPCMAFTLEHDATKWLNASAAVAHLCWAIRKCAGAGLSTALIELLLAPSIEFLPPDPARRRVAPIEKVGYASTQWTNEHEEHLVSNKPNAKAKIVDAMKAAHAAGKKPTRVHITYELELEMCFLTDTDVGKELAAAILRDGPRKAFKDNGNKILGLEIFWDATSLLVD